MTDNNIQGKVLFPLLKLHPSYERRFVKFYLLKKRKKYENQQKMIPNVCFCLAPIRVL